MSCSPTAHKYSDTNDITLTMYKRVGSGAPTVDTATTYYGKYFIDGSTTGTTFETTSGSYTLQNNEFNTATSNVKFEVYSDDNRSVLVDRETIAIIKDAESVGKEDIFMLLDEAGSDTSDGIVRFTDKNGVTHVGLNLDVIKTGALCVGNLPTFDSSNKLTDLNNNKFYANVDGAGDKANVYIGGWTVGSNKLTKGTLGTDGFHMYSSNYGSGGHFGASTP